MKGIGSQITRGIGSGLFVIGLIFVSAGAKNLQSQFRNVSESGVLMEVIGGIAICAGAYIRNKASQSSRDSKVGIPDTTNLGSGVAEKPQLGVGPWKCRCGRENEEIEAACPVCKRSRAAIY